MIGATRRGFLAGLGAGLTAPAFSAQAGSAVWITLGTSGGPQVQPERAQISNALLVGDALYLVDVGNDVQRQLARAGIAERQLKAVFLSHHHLDHNADLGPVMLTHWLFGRGVLPVIGPEGTAQLVSGLAEANAPTALASYPTAGPPRPAIRDMVAARDLAAPLDRVTEVYRDERVRIMAIMVDHYQTTPSVPLPQMPMAVAYRMEAGGRVIVYSGDSGPSHTLTELARGADLLVAEVVDVDAIAARLRASMPDTPATVRDSVVSGMAVNHLTAGNLGRMATAAGVKRLVLTHFVPLPEQAGNAEALLHAVRANYAGPVTLAQDLDRFS